MHSNGNDEDLFTVLKDKCLFYDLVLNLMKIIIIPWQGHSSSCFSCCQAIVANCSVALKREKMAEMESGRSLEGQSGFCVPILQMISKGFV